MLVSKSQPPGRSPTQARRACLRVGHCSRTLAICRESCFYLPEEPRPGKFKLFIAAIRKAAEAWRYTARRRQTGPLREPDFPGGISQPQILLIVPRGTIFFTTPLSRPFLRMYFPFWERSDATAGRRTSVGVLLGALTLPGTSANCRLAEDGTRHGCRQGSYFLALSFFLIQSAHICSKGLSELRSRWRTLRPVTRWTTSSAMFLAWSPARSRLWVMKTT